MKYEFDILNNNEPSHYAYLYCSIVD